MWTNSHPTEKEVAAATAAAPRRVWLIAGTSSDEPYPCRCHESRFGRCSPLWCPCSGRSDVLPEPCCSSRFGPAEWKQADVAYQMKRAAGTA